MVMAVLDVGERRVCHQHLRNEPDTIPVQVGAGHAARSAARGTSITRDELIYCFG